MEDTTTGAIADQEVPPYVPPDFTVISLDCEITAYAPDGDTPLF